MTNLVSVLIALVLMLTGAEGMNGHITLDDISVVVNNETYSPEFSASIGLEGDGETAVAEVAVNASGEALFPLYAKIDDEAAYLQYGDNAPIALSRALIDSDDPTVTAFIDALGNCFEVYSSMLDMGPTAYLDAEQPIIDLLTEMGCLTEEDAVMLLDDGSEIEAVRRVITVDNEQMADFSVKIYDIIAPGYWDAYTNLMSAMTALMGVEDAVPTSIDDIMTMGDMQMTMSGEVLTAENGVEQGMMNVSMNMPIDEEMGYIILDIPMSVNVDENSVTTGVSDISYTVVDMDMPMHLEMTVDGDNAVMTLTSHLDYEGLITDILFTANQTADTFDGTFSFTANEDGTGFVLSAINQTTDDLSVTDCYFSETEDSDTLLSVAFSIFAGFTAPSKSPTSTSARPRTATPCAPSPSASSPTANPLKIISAMRKTLSSSIPKKHSPTAAKPSPPSPLPSQSTL
ncbi:MAG: hypothetical protein MJ099_04455 [Clostridia bacterium]|nr:hypothetical protein [Clostridia bacterium]